MKRLDLIRTIEDNSAVFVRHGSRHDWYRNVITGHCEAVPRHREIDERLAWSIIRKLSTPPQGAN
ncbi:MAG: addiction module toxin, HicA family [bacterium]|nr:addiction module toxin, HicA family [Candidatus Colisoma equi]